MASPKDMLSALIQSGQLTTREREAFEGMWDQVHRTRGRLSNKQQAWVEKVFYEQKLDRPQDLAPKKRYPKIGFIIDPTAKRTVSAVTLQQFETICPHFPKGSPTWKRVADFFRNGGIRFELRPTTPPGKSP